jgi:hypothetical protein
MNISQHRTYRKRARRSRHTRWDSCHIYDGQWILPRRTWPCR